MRYFVLISLLCLSCSKRPLNQQVDVEAKTYIQYMEIIHRGKETRFQAVVEQEPHRLVIVGMTPMGTKGFAATYENGEVHLDKLTGFPLPVDAEELLDAFQLIFLPEAMLKAGLPQGYRVEETSEKREIYKGNQLHVSISYEAKGGLSGTSTLFHARDLYRIKVTTLEVEAL